MFSSGLIAKVGKVYGTVGSFTYANDDDHGVYMENGCATYQGTAKVHRGKQSRRLLSYQHL